MPTATTFETTYQLSNLGPLTTTYSAPASCITGTETVGIARTELPGNPDFGSICTRVSLSPCVPSAAALDQYTQPSSSSGSDQQYLLPYWSPGVVCPSGWTTAGVTSRNTDGSPGTASGAFSWPPTSTTTGTVQAHVELGSLPGHIALAQVLDPGETIVACCPSAYTVDIGGYCYSVLPTSLYQVPAGSTFCGEGAFGTLSFASQTLNVTLNGHPTTVEIAKATGSWSISTYSTTLAPEETQRYVGVRDIMMLNLVHKASDLVSTAPTAATTSSKSTASRGPAVGAVWPLAVVGLTMAAGAALMLQV